MRLAAAIAALVSVQAAHAACPQALAVYSEPQSGAGLEFVADADTFMASNTFRLIVPDGPAMTGYVIWGNGVSRADAMLLHDCPEGDVTGDELRDCTKWEGVIYAVGNDGTVGMVGTETAADKLLLPDVSRALSFDAVNDGKAKLPLFDVFELSGCQE